MSYYQETLATRLATLLRFDRLYSTIHRQRVKADPLDMSVVLMLRSRLLDRAIQSTYRDCEEAGCGDEVLSLAAPYWEAEKKYWRELQEEQEDERRRLASGLE